MLARAPRLPRKGCQGGVSSLVIRHWSFKPVVPGTEVDSRDNLGKVSQMIIQSPRFHPAVRYPSPPVPRGISECFVVEAAANLVGISVGKPGRVPDHPCRDETGERGPQPGNLTSCSWQPPTPNLRPAEFAKVATTPHPPHSGLNHQPPTSTHLKFLPHSKVREQTLDGSTEQVLLMDKEDLGAEWEGSDSRCPQFSPSSAAQV